MNNLDHLPVAARMRVLKLRRDLELLKPPNEMRPWLVDPWDLEDYDLKSTMDVGLAITMLQDWVANHPVNGKPSLTTAIHCLLQAFNELEADSHFGG